MEKLITNDGSATIFDANLNDSYHSRHGALTEARHHFIESGLKEAFVRFGLKLNVLEAGFGTGLNALLTLQEARKHQMEIWYTAIELFPISPDLLNSLGFAVASGFPEDEVLFRRMHDIPYNVAAEVTDTFVLEKRFSDILEFSDHPYRYHLVYYDAFAPSVQPELWTKEAFYRIHDTMAPVGMLICPFSDTRVQRALKSAGFTVELLKQKDSGRITLRATRK